MMTLRSLCKQIIYSSFLLSYQGLLVCSFPSHFSFYDLLKIRPD